MLNIYLSYMPTSSWRVLFWSGVYPRQFSCLKKFRYLVFPGEDCRKKIIIQIIMTPMGFLPNVQSCLRRKVDVMGAYVHETRQINSTHVHTVRRSIYETRLTEHTLFQFSNCNILSLLCWLRVISVL